MSDRPLSLFKLSAAIAFGVWLGFIALALTAWLASRSVAGLLTQFLEQLAIDPVAVGADGVGAVLRFDLGHLFRTWWPVIPIVVGAGFFFSSSK